MDWNRRQSSYNPSTRSEARMENYLNQRESSRSSSTRSVARMEDYLHFFTNRDSRIITPDCTLLAT